MYNNAGSMVGVLTVWHRHLEIPNRSYNNLKLRQVVQGGAGVLHVEPRPSPAKVLIASGATKCESSTSSMQVSQ